MLRRLHICRDKCQKLDTWLHIFLHINVFWGQCMNIELQATDTPTVCAQVKPHRAPSLSQTSHVRSHRCSRKQPDGQFLKFRYLGMLWLPCCTGVCVPVQTETECLGFTQVRTKRLHRTQPLSATVFVVCWRHLQQLLQNVATAG